MAPKTITCTRRIQFCAGHRVLGHESKCANMHGHNYVAFLTAQAESFGEVSDGGAVDSIGRVIDFSVLKALVGGWIDTCWDHGFLFVSHDHEVRAALAAMGPSQKAYELPYNPTAENMARFLLEEVGPEVLAGLSIKLTKVRIWETENCYADATL